MATRFADKGFAPWNVVVGRLSRVIIMIESNDAVTHVTCAWKFHYSTSPLPQPPAIAIVKIHSNSNFGIFLCVGIDRKETNVYHTS